MYLIDHQHPITRERLVEIAQERFGDMVKGVVDVQNRLLVLEADLHSDQEVFLLERGSQQQDLWGINIYPDLEGDDFIEFDSMINLRPSHGNNSRGVDDPQTQQLIREIVGEVIHL